MSASHALHSFCVPRPWQLMTLALFAACSFKHDFSGTQFKCDVSGRCPERYACIEGVCVDSDARTDAPSDPGLDAWASTSALPIGRDYNHPHTALVGDTLYLIGGFDVAQGIETAVVYRAQVTGGQLSAWSTTTPLPAPRALGDIVAVDGRIYVVGGAYGGVATRDVYVATPTTTGDVSSWMPVASLPVVLKAHVALTANGYLYAIGGADAMNQRQSAVYYAAIASNGSLSSWQPTSPLPEPRANLGGVVVGNYIYVIGGDNNADQPYTSVYVASLDPNDGRIGAWMSAEPLPYPRKAFAAVSDSEYIYVIGGSDTAPRAQVLHNRVGVDGTLEAWQDNLWLPEPRIRHTAVLADGHLFVLAGATTPTSVLHASRTP